MSLTVQEIEARQRILEDLAPTAKDVLQMRRREDITIEDAARILRDINIQTLQREQTLATWEVALKLSQLLLILDRFVRTAR